MTLLVALVGFFATGCQSSSNNGQTKTDESTSSEKAQTAMAESETPDKPAVAEQGETEKVPAGDVPPVGSRLELSEKEWRERLTDREFRILRQAGTEARGSGDLLDNKETGVYYCAGCGAPLYSSQAKFDSGTGWPSYVQPYEKGRVDTKIDRSMGMTRTEVHCARCGGHLGHIFDDGPAPTGKRHCINSAALDFKSVEEIRASQATESGEPAESAENTESADSTDAE
jgi:peptide-methionine (R)-S-oxide reductase